MRQAPSGGLHERHGAQAPPTPEPKQLSVVAKRLRHTARLAAMALEGNDPGVGIDYLRDALEMLRKELRPLRRRPRARPTARN